MRRSALLPIGLVAAMGCGARGEPAPETLPAAQAKVADSMVLSAPHDLTIWLTEGRQSTDLAGVPCRERTIEIRRDTIRRTVPLLFTVSPVVLIDDTTLRAEQADHCRPSARYRVNLRTGLPVRIRDSM